MSTNCMWIMAVVYVEHSGSVYGALVKRSRAKVGATSAQPWDKVGTTLLTFHWKMVVIMRLGLVLVLNSNLRLPLIFIIESNIKIGFFD